MSPWAGGTPPSPGGSWSERLSDGRPRTAPEGADGGDSPAWSAKRQSYVPPADLPRPGRAPGDEGRDDRRPAGGGVPYAELHCHSNFSFLDGASHPEELAEEAARLGLEALALTDHDGMYGVVRFAEAAAEVGLRTVFGAELTLDLPTAHRPGLADPGGNHLRGAGPGHRGLRAAVPGHQRRPDGGGREGAAHHRPGHRVGPGRRALAGAHRLPQGGGGAGPVRRGPGRRRPGPGPAGGRPSGATGWRSSCGTTATRSTRPATTPWPRLAVRAGVDVVATNNVHYAVPVPPAGWPPPWPPCGPGAASTRSRAGCRPRPAPACARAASRPGASPATPAWSSGPPSWPSSAPSTSTWWRPTCPTSRCPPATTR